MKYRVKLSAEQRAELSKKVSSGSAPAREVVHALVLLKVDRKGPRLTDQAAAEAVGVSSRTVQRIRQRFVLDGVMPAVSRKKQPDRPDKRKGSDEMEVRLIAAACSVPPDGRRRWTLRLLSDRSVELGLSETPLSRESIRHALKKMNFNLNETTDG
jgi:transposase